jgi:hypothetical protein
MAPQAAGALPGERDGVFGMIETRGAYDGE